MGQIKVNFDVLADAEKRLSALAAGLANRQLELTFSKSEGLYVEKMQERARLLKQIGADLQTLVTSTLSAVEKTRTEFQSADDTVAAAFGCVEK